MLDKFRETAITWDKANRKVYEPLRVSAGDNKGRKLSVQVVNGGVIESLSGASLSLFWETKDKAHKGLDAFTAVDATKGEFEIYYTTGMLSNEGTLNANLVLVDASGRIVSEPFAITVFKGIDDDAIQSSDSFTALTEALAQVGTINNKADRDELLALESTFEQNKVSVEQQLQQISINPEMFGAVGDDVTDDTIAIQTMMDYAFDNQKKVKFLAKNYCISKPILVWGKSGDYTDIEMVVSGKGRGMTKIVKTTTTPYTIPDTTSGEFGEHSKNINACFIIANEFTKQNTPITSAFSDQSVTKKVTIENMSFEGRGVTIDSAIYSLGIMFCNFNNVEVPRNKNIRKGIVTKRYNCYSNYNELELGCLEKGVEFLTPIGGNTTMNFKNCHINGVNGIGFDIKGRAIFENCSIDGGAVIPFNFTDSHSLLRACHFESPSAINLVRLGTASYVVMQDCNMEVQRTDNPTFLVTGKSSLFIDKGSLNLATRTGFPTTTPGKLYETDKNSRFVISELSFKPEQYDRNTKIVFSPTEKIALVYKGQPIVDVNKYIYYVGGAELVENYSKLTLTNDADFSTLSVDKNNGGWAIAFKQKINMTGYSRIYMKGDLTFANGGSNQYEVSVNVVGSLKDDGFVSKGSIVPTIKKDSYFYNNANHEFWVDVSDLTGDYYVEIRLNNVSTIKLKELSVLR